MKIGDLVKLKWSGNGRPSIGIVVRLLSEKPYNNKVVQISWAGWTIAKSYWDIGDLEIISEIR
tara:strand:- start:140 stop:328 length:189 start_codon:yes stop_codon:yes gene_type:complete